MGVVSMSISTCQWVYHLPEPARRLSAQIPLSCNKTQYFGSDRNLVCLSVWDIPQSSQQASMLGLVLSEIFETRLSGCLWVWGLSWFISQWKDNSGSSLGGIIWEWEYSGRTYCLENRSSWVVF